MAIDLLKCAVEELYQQHARPIRQCILHAYKLDDHVADEIVHETFVRALQHVDGLDYQANVRAWLFKVARNLACDYLRHANVIEWTSIYEDAHEHDGSFHTVERSMWINDVREAFESLEIRSDYADLLRQFYFEGQTYKDLALALGTTPQAIKCRMHKARNAARPLLAERLQLFES